HQQLQARVGMVPTMIRYRGRGIARRLSTQAHALADRRKNESVKLDATEQGQPLYEKLGFRCEQSVERWSRTGAIGAADSNATDQPASHQDWRDAERSAFGVDRSELLSKLAR